MSQQTVQWIENKISKFKQSRHRDMRVCQWKELLPQLKYSLSGNVDSLLKYNTKNPVYSQFQLSLPNVSAISIVHVSTGTQVEKILRFI